MKQEADPLKETLVEWLTLNKSRQVLYSSVYNLVSSGLDVARMNTKTLNEQPIGINKPIQGNA